MQPNSDPLYPHNSAQYIELKDILSRLKTPENSPSLYPILCQVRDILEHGNEIRFLPEQNHLSDTSLYDAWHTWLKVIRNTIALYDAKAPDDSHHFIAPTPDSAEVKLLTLVDPERPFVNTSSNLQGLKLILLAVCMLPDEKNHRIKSEKIATDFLRGTNQTALFPNLKLDFSGYSLDELTTQCEELIHTKYHKQSGFRTFLTSIRNSLKVLDGYKLGQQNKSSSTTERSARKRKGKPKRQPNTVRLTPVYSDLASIGDICEIIGPEGEESILGVIEAANDDPEQFDISDQVSSAISQVKSQRWLQHNFELTPWNTMGLNPFTQKLLINWIKDNDCLSSLIFGMMLCTGLKIEDVLNLELGENADLTPNGEYIRYYDSPENSYHPTDEQQNLLAPVTQSIKLALPDTILDRLKAIFSDSNKGRTLAQAYEIDTEITKNEVQRVVRKLIKKGAVGLAIDRIPLVLHKRISEISQDEVLAYILSSRENDLPPVSTYYTAYKHDDLEAFYRQAVEDLYYG